MPHWSIPIRFAIAALTGVLVVLPVIPVAQAQSQAKPLDALFAELKKARDATAARTITDQIWLIWTTPADPRLAARMQDVIVMRQSADFAASIGLLDAIVAAYPTYAEAWNQRATIYYLIGNYEKSLADIDKVLEFEPRHFGALVGRAVIYKTMGKQDLALADMQAALAIHPFLAERALFPELKDIISI